LGGLFNFTIMDGDDDVHIDDWPTDQLRQIFYSLLTFELYFSYYNLDVGTLAVLPYQWNVKVVSCSQKDLCTRTHIYSYMSLLLCYYVNNYYISCPIIASYFPSFLISLSALEKVSQVYSILAEV